MKKKTYPKYAFELLSDENRKKRRDANSKDRLAKKPQSKVASTNMESAMKCGPNCPGMKVISKTAGKIEMGCSCASTKVEGMEAKQPQSFPIDLAMTSTGFHLADNQIPVYSGTMIIGTSSLYKNSAGQKFLLFNRHFIGSRYTSTCVKFGTGDSTKTVVLKGNTMVECFKDTDVARIQVSNDTPGKPVHFNIFDERYTGKCYIF